MSTPLTGSVVVVTGAGGGAGGACVAGLLSLGCRVVAADVTQAPLDRLVEAAGDKADSLTTVVVDLLDTAATAAWADDLSTRFGRVDGVVHLVGGWRGGKVFADNSFEDWDLLHSLLIRTVQNTTLAFHDALADSSQGRFVLISAQAVDTPTAGSAGYAAAKAAAETWTMAMADSFAKLQGDDLHSAAVVLRVKALLTPAMREAKPDAAFAGYTTVEDLAVSIAGLWSQDAAAINGQRITA